MITLKSMCQQLEWHMEENADNIHTQGGGKKNLLRVTFVAYLYPNTLL